MNVPKLRFGEFNKEWKCKNLGDIAQFSKGKGIAKADISTDGQFECIRYGELYTHYKETIKQVISRTNLSADELVFSETNDVIIPASGETQLDIATASCVLKKGVALGGDLNIIKSDANGVFLSYYLNNAKKQSIANLAQGISVVHLYASQLKTLELNVPNSDEQQKIADFLSAVDEKITALTAQKTALTQYKQGMMQRIFSQTLRFKDDNGADYPEWKNVMFGDIASFSKGKGISKADISDNGKLECIRYGELYTYYKETIKSVISRTNQPISALVLSEANDVIIPSSGETQLDIATASCVLKAGVALGGDLNIIKSDVDGVFLAYYLNNAKKQSIANLAQGISVVHLYANQLKTMDLDIPEKQEQRKIAQFLTELDDKINAVDTQIQSAQQWKQGLLQQMFV